MENPSNTREKLELWQLCLGSQRTNKYRKKKIGIHSQTIHKGLNWD